MDVVCVDTLITGPTEHQIVDNLRAEQSFYLLISFVLMQINVSPLLFFLDCAYVHAENGLAVALQRSQQQSIIGVSHADGAVVGAHQQDPSGALLGRGQTADGSRPVAFEHLHLPVGLNTFSQKGFKKPPERIAKDKTHSLYSSHNLDQSTT